MLLSFVKVCLLWLFFSPESSLLFLTLDHIQSSRQLAMGHNWLPFLSDHSRIYFVAAIIFAFVGHLRMLMPMIRDCNRNPNGNGIGNGIGNGVSEWKRRGNIAGNELISAAIAVAITLYNKTQSSRDFKGFKSVKLTCEMRGKSSWARCRAWGSRWCCERRMRLGRLKAMAITLHWEKLKFVNLKTFEQVEQEFPPLVLSRR